MQSFLFPQNLLKKMDRRIKSFFWGFKDEQRHHLHLKSWKLICQPKATDGLGIQLMGDINYSLLTKRAWQLCTAKERTWVKLMRAKYLRGQRLLDDTLINGSTSWLWNEIKKCLPFLRVGVCFQIEAQSTLRIIGDPWLHNLLEFRLVDDSTLDHQMIFIRDLVDSLGTHWDCRKVQATFPQQICREILNTPILEKGQERLIWTPPMSGVFTVKSAYWLITQHRYDLPVEEAKRTWNSIWNMNLHGRHSILLWRVLNNALPSLDRISTFIGRTQDTCYLCKSGLETIKHLQVQFQIVKLLWRNSPWQTRIEAFQSLEVLQWIALVFGNRIPFLGGEKEILGSWQFLAMALEQIWLIRNKIWQGENPPNWYDFSLLVNKVFHRYWKRSMEIPSKHKVKTHQPQ